MDTQNTEINIVGTFKAIRDYNWDDDIQFQHGLYKILLQFPNGDIENLTISAKCYYWNRFRKTDNDVDPDAFRKWLLFNGPSPNPTAGRIYSPTHTKITNIKDAPHSDAFSRIVQLIKSGELIPGSKEIPDIVNDSPPSEIKRAERKKPWEVTAGHSKVDEVE